MIHSESNTRIVTNELDKLYLVCTILGLTALREKASTPIIKTLMQIEMFSQQRDEHNDETDSNNHPCWRKL